LKNYSLYASPLHPFFYWEQLDEEPLNDKVTDAIEIMARRYSLARELQGDDCMPQYPLNKIDKSALDQGKIPAKTAGHVEKHFENYGFQTKSDKYTDPLWTA
jgi:hypothetical protein